jgi:hypothetical protein
VNQDTLRLIPVVLAWLAVAYKFPALKKGRSSEAARALWLSLLLFACALTILIPGVYLAIDRLTNVPNLARLLGHTLVIFASCSSLALLIHLSVSRKQAATYVRRALWLAISVNLILGLCFVLSKSVVEEPIAFTAHYADSVFIEVYRLAFIAYVGIMLLAVVRLSIRYRLVSRSHPSMHLGITFVIVGAILGLGYVAHGLLYLLARRLNLPYPIPDDVASTVLGALSVSTVVVGATMPEWGSLLPIPQAYQWFDNRRACRRLYPLWRDLSACAPDVVLGSVPSPLADAISLRDVGIRLYRRVVEIRDGRLAIAFYVPPGTAERAEVLGRAAGLTGHELLATIEAACLRAAAQAKRRNQEVASRGSVPRTINAIELADEVAFLQLVAEAYGHSRIVKAVTSELSAYTQ